MTRALILAVAVAPLLAGAAWAQTPPQALPPGPSTWEQHRYQADQHRYEMDRLRLQAEQREVTARQIELQSRQTRMELERHRDLNPSAAPYAEPRALRSPEEERTLRQSATERRRATESSVGQIDAWLDRRPN
jgi:hypothetical protein